MHAPAVMDVKSPRCRGAAPDDAMMQRRVRQRRAAAHKAVSGGMQVGDRQHAAQDTPRCSTRETSTGCSIRQARHSACASRAAGTRAASSSGRRYVEFVFNSDRARGSSTRARRHSTRGGSRSMRHRRCGLMRGSSSPGRQGGLQPATDRHARQSPSSASPSPFSSAVIIRQSGRSAERTASRSTGLLRRQGAHAREGWSAGVPRPHRAVSANCAATQSRLARTTDESRGRRAVSASASARPRAPPA